MAGLTPMMELLFDKFFERRHNHERDKHLGGVAQHLTAQRRTRGRWRLMRAEGTSRWEGIPVMPTAEKQQGGGEPQGQPARRKHDGMIFQPTPQHFPGIDMVRQPARPQQRDARGGRGRGRAGCLTMSIPGKC